METKTASATIKPEVEFPFGAIPTMERLKAACVKAGHSVSSASWENESHIYVFSKDTVPGTMGHARWEAHFDKLTGWLEIPGMVNHKF